MGDNETAKNETAGKNAWSEFFEGEMGIMNKHVPR